MSHRRNVVLCLTLALACANAAAQLARRKQPGYTPPVSNDTSTPPQVPITLYNGESDNPYVRFTVGHSHAFSYCTGYLDINATTITYTSLTQPSDSFSLPRSSIGRATLRMKSWVVIPTPGRNYDFLLVRQDLVRGGQSNQTLYKNHFDPSPILEFVNDWEPRLAQMKRELHVGERPPQPIVTEPPKPVVATLHLISQPGNVQVYLDGRFKGETSQSGELVVESTPGGHTLRMDLANYKEYTEQVTLSGDMEKRVTLQSQGPEPLSEAEIEDALANGMTPTRVAEKVKEFGVNFELTDDVEKKLRDKGADDALLLVIARNKK